VADSSTLREYVVKLGFSVQEEQFRRFQEAMGSVTKGAVSIVKSFVEVGGALVATAKVADTTFQKFAKPMENLYFAAQRLNSAPAQIAAFGAALEQVGISADETNAAIMNFQQLSERLGQGNKNALGIDPRIQGNSTLAFYQGLQNIAAQDNGTAQSHRAAQLKAENWMGVSQDFYDQYKLHQAEIPGFIKQAADIAGKSNLDASARKIHEAEISRRWTGFKAELTGDDLAGQEAGKMKGLYDATGLLIDKFNELNRATGGLLSEALVGAGLLGTFLASLGGLKLATKLLTGSAGGAAATGAAAVAEGGLGSTIAGIITIAIPLVIAALASYELFRRKDAVESEGKKLLDGLPSFVGNKTYDSADISNWVKGHVKPMLGYISKGLTDFVAGFEGHAKDGYGVYNDIGGHATAGYGHLVRPGENLNGLDKQGAMALLGQDLAGALAEVKRAVHVALTGNQTKALTDFVFNLGAGNFEKSMLLKELNAGHYEAAAARFEDYNKVLQNGHYVVNEALARRRATEAATFRAPDSKSVNLDVTNHFNITGNKDPQATADAVASRQTRINNDLVRNTQPAVV
jgi:GH24 family phage-related lysozyme (muramidase)